MVPRLLLTLLGCLERVTGEDVPLDARFYAGAPESDQPSAGAAGPGAPGGDPAGGGASGDAPWAEFTGETVLVRFVVEGEGDDAVQVDVNTPDASSPGGQRRAGAVHLDAPGPFELKVPRDVTQVRIEAFQDPDSDGPSDQDPYASTSIDLAAGAPADVVPLVLKAGARGRPGAPGGGAGGGGGGGGGPMPQGPGPEAAFGDVPMVRLAGTLVLKNPAVPVKIDLFKVDATTPAGRAYLFKIDGTDGRFDTRVPRGYGPMELEAYQDVTGDGPTADDPRGRYEPSPLVVGDADVIDLRIEIH